MTKKKWYEQPKTIIASIAAVIVAIGIIWNWVLGLVNFSRWPEVTKAIAGEVEQVKGDIIDLKSYVAAQKTANEINQKANELMEQRIQQQPQQQAPIETCPYQTWYDGHNWCWDGKNQTWYQQGGQ